MQPGSDSVSEELFAQFARVTAALAAPGRLKLLDRLCQGEQNVETLAEASGLTVANASHHLRVLAGARLVSSRRAARQVFYRLADDAVGRFWFALRDLARDRLAEVDRAVAAYLAGDPGLAAISRAELLERMAAGDVVVLDVRPGAEYRAGHIAGAVSIPLDELAARMAALPPGRQVVAYCRGPYCFLAVDAVRMLRARGLAASRLEDGLPEWRAAGLPVETNA
ncbi:MAG: metalloregulator ArsR/SmtB family transcription factor [Thermoflexaceae bacterium]|nr:metalloregulator ArsR/SmtB family transcription factor [Thermoflexaceae bacterium]